MRVVRNALLPPRGFDAINILGTIFCRKDTDIDASLLRHECIHTAQMKEMLYVGFYLGYLIEWLIRLPMKGRAYNKLLMEREAYTHMEEADYLEHRRHFAWLLRR